MENEQLKISHKSDELYYANLLHDSIKGSPWLKKQDFSLFGWAANYSFIYLLFRILDKTSPMSILEFGLGQTTRVTSQYVTNKNSLANLIVCEDNKDWIDIYSPELLKSDNIKINHCELEFFDYENERNDKYANLQEITHNQKFNLIIIDGPTGGGKNFPRSNINDLIKKQHLMNDFIIIFDDAERPGEQLTILKTKEALKEKNVEFIEFKRTGLKTQHVIASISKSFVQYL